MSVKIADIELFTVDELADKFDVQDRTILAYIKEGKLKAQKMGKRWYISSESIKEYFEGDETKEIELEK
jgi:excisionase family DNA binding protein